METTPTLDSSSSPGGDPSAATTGLRAFLAGGRQWPIFICALLGVVVLCDLAVIYVASHHPTFAAAEGYDRHAAAWDAERAAARASRDLGWSVGNLTIDSYQNDHRPVALALELKDEREQPLHGALVAVRAFHRAHPKEVVAAVLAEGSTPGGYAGRLPIARAGLWQLELTAMRGDQRFATTLTVTQELARSR